MAMAHDEIVDIPENRVKFFGTRGKMLLPSPETVMVLIEKIPKGKLATTGMLREELRTQFKVEGTCPVTTKKALDAIASNAGNSAPYWRVINQNGGLISSFPGGVEGQAERLRQEGQTIDASGKSTKVEEYKDNLFQFG